MYMQQRFATHSFPERAEPKATAWASRFFATLTATGWYEHPIYSSRTPHVTEFMPAFQHVFGSQNLARSESGSQSK